MTKLFRKYQKWLLAVLGTTLMILFLLPGANVLQSANEGRQEIGRLGSGRVLRQSERNAALLDLTLLAQRSPDPLFGGDPKENADRWMLLLAEAEELGLGASAREVETGLSILGFQGRGADGKSTGLIDEVELANYAGKQNATPADMRSAVRHYLMAAQMHDLITGAAYSAQVGGGFASPGLQRMMLVRTATEAQMELQQLRYAYMQALMSGQQDQLGALQGRLLALQSAMLLPEGGPRLSLPAMAKADVISEAKMACRILELPARAPARADASAEPSADTLAGLLARLGATPRGKGENGLGYQLPARAQVEAVGVPAVEARRLVEAELTQEDIRAHYDAHSGEFQGGLTQANRKAIGERLVQERVPQKAEALLKAAGAVLHADIKAAAAGGAFTPTALSEVSKGLRAAGVEPVELTAAQVAAACLPPEPVAGSPAKAKAEDDLYYGTQDGWVSAAALQRHPRFGDGERGPRATAVKYPQVTPALLLAQVADPKGAGQALPLGLSVGAGQPLPLVRDEDGGVWLLRCTTAEAPHAPKGVDEVRPWLVRDARALAAYERLVAAKDNLLDLAAREGLEKVGGPGEKPFTLPGITRAALIAENEEAPFMRQVFDEAERLSARHPDFRDAPVQERLLAYPHPKGLSLRLVELGTLARPPESQFKAFLANPVSRVRARELLLPTLPDPLTKQALEQRLKVTWAGAEEEKKAETPAQEPVKEAAQEPAKAQP